jgi:riboflavin synthase
VFTGLIAEVGQVRTVDHGEEGATLKIDAGLADSLREGDSVAVNGVCLTATAVAAGGFEAQAMHETLRRSSLGGLGAGSGVNLELPLRPSDRLGGHFVQGHVDGTGVVGALAGDGFALTVTIGVADAIAPYLVSKGSVAVDGVSLTVAEVGAGSFTVSLIPETLERTTLGTLSEGQIVNIEADVLAKHIERLLQMRSEFAPDTSSAPEVRT